MFCIDGWSLPFSDAGKSSIDYTTRAFNAKQDCRSLRSVTTAEFTVVNATPVPITHSDGSEGSYCRVSGVIPSEVRFEINLPGNWNGRLFMFGNGGLAGTPPEDKARRQSSQWAVRFGFATAYTDTGHDRRVEPGGQFAYKNLHKLIDYGYRAVHMTLGTAKKLAAQYYGSEPNYNYFMGCSTGGRQALMSAQRFPEDFDGIIAGAPAHDYSGLKFSQAWRMKAMKDKPFSVDEVRELSTHIYRQCDSLDGLSDGLIDDPRVCNFDPARDLPRCDGEDSVTCFDEAEISALQQYYSQVSLAGTVIYPGHPVGSEVDGAGYDGVIRPGWIPWLLNEDGPALLDLLGSDFFRYMVFIKDDPDFDWIEFDYKEQPDNLGQFRDIVDAIDPDLSRFKDRGGKLISYFGWADPDINPLNTIDYFDAVSATTGDVDSFYRLYMVPGMFHCAGGPGPTDFDVMTPLINWVEGGQANEVIPAKHLDGNVMQYSRPLCTYPKVARLKSEQLDPDKMENFHCVLP
jgi:feruloyl esterase